MHVADSSQKQAFESIRYKYSYEEQLNFNWQSSKDFTIVLILGGQGRRFIGDSMSEFRKGDLVIIPPEVPFAYHNDLEYPGVEYVCICFNHRFAGKDFFTIPEMTHCSGLLKRSDRGLKITEVPHTLKEVILEMKEMVRLNKLLTFLTVLDSLAELPAEILTSEKYKAYTSRDDMERIQVVCRYINNNYQKNISAEKLGSLISMSPPSFCRFFKRVMNKTFHRYLCEIRIALAKKLLSNTEMMTEDVGRRCGFKTIPGFTARFKDLTEHTPAAYRRLIKVK